MSRSSSYDTINANIQIKINGAWQLANPDLREMYIEYKTMPFSSSATTYSKDGITIFEPTTMRICRHFIDGMDKMIRVWDRQRERKRK